MTDSVRTPPAPEFAYRDGALFAEDVSLEQLATVVGTPAYCYSQAALDRRYHEFADAFADQNAMICYAVKANGNQAVIAALARQGAGADVVSEGELRLAIAAGVPPERIVFSGVGKTRQEMAFALDSGIRQINVESAPELEVLAEVAAAKDRTATVVIRVNPDVDARTHAKITTGTAENKFGVDLAHVPEVYARAEALDGIVPVGLAVHIGSQLLELTPFRSAFTKLAELVAELRAAGHAVSRLDIGGGVGIRYGSESPPDIAGYAEIVRELLGPLGCELIVEPGRAMVGNAGVLLTRVLYVKQGVERRFIIVDAAMNDLLRPAMYDAGHAIVPLVEPAADAVYEPADVVGPICETGDSFATGRAMPPLVAEALLAICSAGAYGAVMASSYNGRLLVPEVLVHGDRFAVIRPRQGFADLLAQDSLPDWLSQEAQPAARIAAGRGSV
ncbi:MAG: diaminopimelate decarboxylase [Alphaproteobacteria bacterium]|nr:diaminopimelate decarboxylase [Alphaproteobacteria bacterium]